MATKKTAPKKEAPTKVQQEKEKRTQAAAQTAALVKDKVIAFIDEITQHVGQHGDSLVLWDDLDLSTLTVPRLQRCCVSSRTRTKSRTRSWSPRRSNICSVNSPMPCARLSSMPSTAST